MGTFRTFTSRVSGIQEGDQQRLKTSQQITANEDNQSIPSVESIGDGKNLSLSLQDGVTLKESFGGGEDSSVPKKKTVQKEKE